MYQKINFKYKTCGGALITVVMATLGVAVVVASLLNSTLTELHINERKKLLISNIIITPEASNPSNVSWRSEGSRVIMQLSLL